MYICEAMSKDAGIVGNHQVPIDSQYEHKTDQGLTSKTGENGRDLQACSKDEFSREHATLILTLLTGENTTPPIEAVLPMRMHPL